MSQKTVTNFHLWRETKVVRCGWIELQMSSRCSPQTFSLVGLNPLTLSSFDTGFYFSSAIDFFLLTLLVFAIYCSQTQKLSAHGKCFDRSKSNHRKQHLFEDFKILTRISLLCSWREERESVRAALHQWTSTAGSSAHPDPAVRAAGSATVRDLQTAAGLPRMRQQNPQQVKKNRPSKNTVSIPKITFCKLNLEPLANQEKKETFFLLSILCHFN